MHELVAVVFKLLNNIEQISNNPELSNEAKLDGIEAFAKEIANAIQLYITEVKFEQNPSAEAAKSVQAVMTEVLYYLVMKSKDYNLLKPIETALAFLGNL